MRPRRDESKLKVNPAKQKAEADNVGMGEFNAAAVVIRFWF